MSDGVCHFLIYVFSYQIFYNVLSRSARGHHLKYSWATFIIKN